MVHDGLQSRSDRVRFLNTVQMAYADKNDPRNREAKRKHYYENKEQYLERNRQKKEKLRNIVLEFKAVPCLDCGNHYPEEPWLMELDHRDPTEKLCEISKLVLGGNESKLRAELDKCDALCLICHRKRSAKMFGWTANRFSV